MKTRISIVGTIALLLIAGCQQEEPAPTPSPSATVDVEEKSTAAPPTEASLSEAVPTEVVPTETPPTATSTPSLPTPEPTESALSEAGQFEPQFTTSPCPFVLPPDETEGETITCGYVTVPEIRGVPEIRDVPEAGSGSDAATLRLAVVVFSARDDSPQPDPVMLLAGGPGEKTVENAVNVALILDLFRDNRDLIVFDQRGVGLSEPALECPEFTDAILETLGELDAEISLTAIYDGLMTCRDRLVAEGINLSAFNTTENAADVDDIRRALGYEQINIYGGSYGTQLAQAIMRDHPDGIRSVTLGAVLPLDKSFFVHVPTTVVDATLHLLESCAADEACSAAYPDLQQTLYDTIDQLNADPVPITITNPLDGQSYDSWLTGDEVFSNLATFLYITDIIPVLPQAIHDVSQGDYGLMTQLSSTKLALLDALSRGMTYSVFCAEDLVGVTPEDFLETRAQMPPQLAGRDDPEDIIEYSFFGVCQEWPVEQVDPSFKEPVISDIPTLMLEGEFDPVTPLSYAEEVAQHLSSSYLYEFPAVGHTVLVSSPCAQEIADQFMDDPTTEPDSSCLSQLPAIAFDLPLPEFGEIDLEPVTDLASGLSGLAPAGWESSSPGTYVRGENALDPTALIIDLLPLSQEGFLDLIATRLSLDVPLVSIGERESEHFTWALFSEEVQGVAVDIAVTAIDEETTLMVILQQPAEERDILYDQLFLPAVDALHFE